MTSGYRGDLRQGETDLREFIDYVEKQRKNRHCHTTKIPEHDETHSELDFLDSLELSNPCQILQSKDLLLGKNDDSLQKLSTLIETRIAEGHGEFVFDIGLKDNGDSMNLEKDEWEIAVKNLTEAAKKSGAACKILSTKNVGDEQDVDSVAPGKDKGCNGKILVRKQPSSMADVMEVRIAVVGNVDAGKSTMLGVLAKGCLDDGRGKARVNLFRHKHEIESGRTSSVCMAVLGYDVMGQVIAADPLGSKQSWQEIGKRAAKVISFTDLAGHERYLRTTVFGLLSCSPDFGLLIVAANNGLVGMSKEHLGITLALNVPVMVIITKIDICPPKILEQTIQQITRILKSPGARKVPIFIKNIEDCVNTSVQFVTQRICPIFQVSNVTGESLGLVREFLNLLPNHGQYDAQASFEFHVNDTFSVPFVGTVVSGVVKSGVIHTGDSVFLGPDATGQFMTTKIKSIERKRIPVPLALAGQSVSFALKKLRRKDVRRGMVVVPKTEEAPPTAVREFVAEVLILSHSTTIKPKYQAMLHVGSLCQTCVIIDLDRSCIRTGDRALVAFRFLQRPEYIVPGDRLIFREGRTKGLGIIKSVGYNVDKPLGGLRQKEADEERDGRSDKVDR
ncbi:unnamed protein product [Blumeria hordei]|uniref:Tr-type G domain-containing protein n=1 Tax=Blumeria hordei TaxID=2867405 RepID=A0A383UNC3_BLUHO|nr:unnamed protein product [Blumeria hordei]